jgi:multisubunit Na+/H+ antiporter MnhB subunit
MDEASKMHIITGIDNRMRFYAKLDTAMGLLAAAPLVSICIMLVKDYDAGIGMIAAIFGSLPFLLFILHSRLLPLEITGWNRAGIMIMAGGAWATLIGCSAILLPLFVAPITASVGAALVARYRAAQTLTMLRRRASLTNLEVL